MAINYESGRAYALSSLSQEHLHNPELFAQWADGFIAAINQPKQKVSGPHVTIYTDGACSGNPGPGGWGAVLILGSYVKEYSGCAVLTTNNRMELTAAVKGLSALKRPCRVTICSDSAYMVNAFNENWLGKWQKNGWINSQNKPVENREIWEELLRLVAIHDVSFSKVKGHADDEWNNRCDQLAVAGRDKVMQEIASVAAQTEEAAA